MKEFEDNYFWQGKKVRLRPRIKDDWKKSHLAFSDSDAIRLSEWGIELPKSEEMSKEHLEKYINFKKTDDFLKFSIETVSGELVGWINMTYRDQKNGVFSFGISIFKKYRQKGYGEEAVRILLRYGFFEQRYQKCNSGCSHNNSGSIKLHKKVGFIEEGRQRRTIYTNGRFYDNLLFGITREEFEKNDALYDTE